jgi:ribosomal protein S18 acetylase RimI-like enzyme
MYEQADCIEGLRAELVNPVIREILAPTMYNPTAERVAQVCQRYQTEPTWRLFGYRHRGAIVGCLGLELSSQDQVVIRHIAVAPTWRGHGIGKALIRYAIRTLAVRYIVAETDCEAVEFYRRCGFAVQSLGEIYPGTERFLCSYSVDGTVRA